MRPRNEAMMLVALAESPAYRKLMELWVEDVTAIEEKRDRCASRNSEMNWKYHAGLEKGYKQCMMRLAGELALIESEGGEVAEEPSAKIEKLLSEARGEQSER